MTLLEAVRELDERERKELERLRREMASAQLVIVAMLLWLGREVKVTNHNMARAEFHDLMSREDHEGSRVYWAEPVKR